MTDNLQKQLWQALHEKDKLISANLELSKRYQNGNAQLKSDLIRCSTQLEEMNNKYEIQKKSIQSVQDKIKTMSEKITSFESVQSSQKSRINAKSNVNKALKRTVTAPSKSKTFNFSNSRTKVCSNDDSSNVLRFIKF